MRSSMRVLFDSLGFEGPWGGVPRYFVELVKNLPPAVEPLLAVAESSCEALHVSPFGIPPARLRVSDVLPGTSFPGKRRLYLFLARCFPSILPASEVANERLLERTLREGAVDLVHLTAPHQCADSWRRVVGRLPFVVTVHDLIPELVLDDRRTREDRKRVLSTAAAIIAVSQATKADIVNTYGVDEQKITVVHHGVDSGSWTGLRVPQDPQEPDFLLYVGARDGYKNWSSFIRYAAYWVLERPKRRIVCAGRGFRDDERRLLSELGLAGRVDAWSVTDDELRQLYCSAFAFVYPSTHEGFGLPVLEAMSAGCPVILSDIPVLREVAGEAALYFSGAEDLRQALSLLEDRDRRRCLVESGRAQAGSYTWVRCARETAAVYRRALAG